MPSLLYIALFNASHLESLWQKYPASWTLMTEKVSYLYKCLQGIISLHCLCKMLLLLINAGNPVWGRAGHPAIHTWGEGTLRSGIQRLAIYRPKTTFYVSFVESYFKFLCIIFLRKSEKILYIIYYQGWYFNLSSFQSFQSFNLFIFKKDRPWSNRSRGSFNKIYCDQIPLLDLLKRSTVLKSLLSIF